jgi:hypothetical protein
MDPVEISARMMRTLDGDGTHVLSVASLLEWWHDRVAWRSVWDETVRRVATATGTVSPLEASTAARGEIRLGDDADTVYSAYGWVARGEISNCCSI